MCGVIGLIYERHRADLGRIAGELLKTLEYRGYDSTGAAIQGDDQVVHLAKGVGAPSQMVHQLGIVERAGRILCGQVRWATFGAVDEANSQPHEVQCKLHMYGAHNGNVTNCDDLQAWLRQEGHSVASDNDGEMVVHTVEHFFGLEIAAAGDADPAERRACMRRAIVSATHRLEGSFAAVVVDPLTHTLWAIKQGSSLYFGLGADDTGGAFRIASSDLSSVLHLTRVVVPLREGEMVEMVAGHHQLYSVADGTPLERTPVRSRLRAKDTALLPQFETFMEQEIASQTHALSGLVTLFLGGTEASRVLRPYLDARPQQELAAFSADMDAMRDQYDDEIIAGCFHALVDSPAGQALIESIPGDVKDRGTIKSHAEIADRLVSSEAGFFTDLLGMARHADDLLTVRLMDVLLEVAEVDEFAESIDRFSDLCIDSVARGGRLFVVCCGSSYNAAKAAALFFNEIARTPLVPVLPGQFRGQQAKSLRDGDLFVAVSQSGETKDLIDVMNAVIASGRDVRRVAVVNNVNSTLAQEKSELVIPLRCGPEVAVPATKSFMNQMAVLYCLALRLGQRRLRDQGEDAANMHADLERRTQRLRDLPALIQQTFESTEADVERAAQLLFLAPSIHVLATRIDAVASEGALKIREVVLNHTEGFEGSEFKHGPNTILGFNTLFGPAEVDRLLKTLGEAIGQLLERAHTRGMGGDAMARLAQAATDSVFSVASFTLDPAEQALLDQVVDRETLVASLYADYPLLYITGPEERDVLLTVSQINTHKIRGACTVVIAEAHTALEQAATKAPADNPAYKAVYVTLPRTDDTLMAVFSSTVVLQRLALKMSLLKAQHLDRLGIRDHGVHPDVPKNVSKSITVD